MVADLSRDGIYVTPRIDTLTKEGAERSRLMKAGSVVMAVSGAPGLPAILTVDACIHDGFVGFRDLSDEVTPEYFVSLLASLRTRNAAQAEGAIFQNLKTNQIDKWVIPVPPLELQRSYTSFMKEVLRLEKECGDTTNEFVGMFQSLLARAFIGELTLVWRDQHQAELRDAAEKQNEWLKARGFQRLTVSTTVLESSDSSRNALLTRLSPVQQRVYALTRNHPTTYFTLQTLWEAQSDDASLDRDIIERGLTMLEALGIMLRVRVPVSPTSEAFYQSVYRRAAAPRIEEELRALKDRFPNIRL